MGRRYRRMQRYRRTGGVVDDDVRQAGLSDDAVHRLRHRFRVAHIGRDGEDLPAGGSGDLARCRIQHILLP